MSIFKNNVFLLFLFEAGIKQYLQDNWTVCEPLEYLMLLPDIQEVKCFEFTVQMLPPPLGASLGAKKIIVRFANILPPPTDWFLYTPLFRTKYLNGGWRKPWIFYRGLKETLNI